MSTMCGLRKDDLSDDFRAGGSGKNCQVYDFCVSEVIKFRCEDEKQNRLF